MAAKYKPTMGVVAPVKNVEYYIDSQNMFKAYENSSYLEVTITC
jgi:hypothetical protein